VAKGKFWRVFISAALCTGSLFSYCVAQTQKPIAHWTFDETKGRSARDSIRDADDQISDFFKRVPGVAGEALRLDGETTSIRRKAQDAPHVTQAFTVQAWIAVNTYPWNWVPLVDQSQGEQQGDLGYTVGVDAFGHFGVRVAVNGKFQTLVSKDPLPLKKWTFVAATFANNHGLKIYINGQPAGELQLEGDFTPAGGQDLVVGRVRQATLPLEWIHPKFAVWYSFDGILDELEIYNRALDAPDIATEFARVRLPEAAPLKWPKLPSGDPPGPGRFGAYYADLKFDDMWDTPRRVGPNANIVVRFDQSPIRLVFWQGTNYVPAWVTENGKWYTDEFMETGGSPGCPLGEDCEPMSDKQNRYSHVRILESNNARAVIHWRYGLCEVEQYVCANPDPFTGWTDWADEYYYVYPDGIAVRKGIIWSSNLTKGREFQETIVINAPGTRPEDNINTDALTFSNMDGQTQVVSWAHPPKKGTRWDDNIQLVNLKSKWKPFQIVIPPGVARPYVGEKTYSMFEWWNHWPVQQVKSSGISAVAPDKASHTSLSHLEGKTYAQTDDTITKVMMDGLTTLAPTELPPLARSWLSPPKVELRGPGFQNKGYDPAQRAFVFARTAPGASLKVLFHASSDSPLFHPVLLIKEWGDTSPVMKIGGKALNWGADYRFGRVYTLDGSDLVVWMRLKATTPVSIELGSGKGSVRP